MSDYYTDLADYLRTNGPPGYARATLTCEWFAGVIKGPAATYFDAAGAHVPSTWSMGTQRQMSKLFGPRSEGERAANAKDGGLPNVFTLAVTPDGDVETCWTHDRDAQAREDARLRAELGDAEYERLQQPQQPPKPRVTPPTPDEARIPKPMSVPELLGFIQQEIAKDAPGGWSTLRVEGEVWQDGGINNIKTVYYYTLPNDAQRRQFSASNMIGPMNAVQQLQRVMAGEGNVWRKVQIEFTAGTSRTLIDTQ